MNYMEFATSKGPYLIDFALLNRMLEQSFYIKSLRKSAKITKMPGGGPDIYSVDVDWKQARQAELLGPKSFMSAYNIPTFFTDLLKQSSSEIDFREIERLRKDMFELEKEAWQASQDLKDMRRKASDRGMKNIQRAVAIGEMGVEVSTFIRDASIDGLLLGGTVLTGGAAAGLVTVAGGAAILKGGAKYQDTENIGASVLTASFEFVTAIIPGQAASKLGSYALVFSKKLISFQGDVAVGLVEGKTLSESAVGASVKLGVGTLTGPLKNSVLGDKEAKLIANQVLEKQIVPTAITVMGANAVESKVNGVASEASTQKIMKIISANGKRPSSGFKNTVSSVPLRVDYAIVGPYQSEQPRTFTE